MRQHEIDERPRLLRIEQARPDGHAPGIRPAHTAGGAALGKHTGGGEELRIGWSNIKAGINSVERRHMPMLEDRARYNPNP